MAQSRGYMFVFIIGLGGSALIAACGSADQDRIAERRALAQKACEDAVRDQLSSRATAQFSGNSEHVYYDSLGGAGVTGTVATVSGQRNFACILKLASDSTWTLTAARLMN